MNRFESWFDRIGTGMSLYGMTLTTVGCGVGVSLLDLTGTREGRK